jgi:hypothetical protein
MLAVRKDHERDAVRLTEIDFLPVQFLPTLKCFYPSEESDWFEVLATMVFKRDTQLREICIQPLTAQPLGTRFAHHPVLRKSLPH